MHSLYGALPVQYDHFATFFNLKKFSLPNRQKSNKSIHYWSISQNALSALDEMLAVTNFTDIIRNVNIYENIKKMQNYYWPRQNKMSLKLCARFKYFINNQIKQAKINYFASMFQQFKWRL